MNARIIRGILDCIHMQTKEITLLKARVDALEKPTKEAMDSAEAMLQEIERKLTEATHGS